MIVTAVTPTDKKTFLITFIDRNILQTVETKHFDSSVYFNLKKQPKRFWNNYLKTGGWITINKKILKK